MKQTSSAELRLTQAAAMLGRSSQRVGGGRSIGRRRSFTVKQIAWEF
jgi:hypothetical protein